MAVARAGKSTYAERWASGEEMPELTGKRVKWTQDQCRLVLTGERFNRHIEPLGHVIKEIVIKTHLLDGCHVLVDGTHTTEKSIKNLLLLDLEAKPILFDTPPDVCKRRAIETQQEDLLPVIDRQHEQLRLLLNEGLDNVMTRLRGEVSKEYLYRWSRPLPMKEGG